MKETNPDKKLTEISKMIAAEWKVMDNPAKKPYEVEAKELKEKYETEMKKYKETPQFREHQKKLKNWKAPDGNGKGKGKKTDGKRTKKLKDVNAQKKPQSAYFLFAGDRRPKLRDSHPDKKITEVAKLLGAEWKEISEADKKPWEERAKKLKEQYEKDWEAYKQTDHYREFQKKVKQEKEQRESSSSGEEKSSSSNGESGSGSDDDENSDESE